MKFISVFSRKYDMVLKGDMKMQEDEINIIYVLPDLNCIFIFYVNYIKWNMRKMNEYYSSCSDNKRQMILIIKLLTLLVLWCYNSWLNCWKHESISSEELFIYNWYLAKKENFFLHYYQPACVTTMQRTRNSRPCTGATVPVLYIHVWLL